MVFRGNYPKILRTLREKQKIPNPVQIRLNLKKSVKILRNLSQKNS